MSFLRASRNLPRHTAMQLSPWLLVGSALILGLAIAFWAVKNARLEQENMFLNLQDRASALMWAMEGGARAGRGMHSVSSYLQFMLEETARQPGILYMAVVSQSGIIMAHNDRQRIGAVLYPPEDMESIVPASRLLWRVVESGRNGTVFEAFKKFAPLPDFSAHMGHGRTRRMLHGMGRGFMHRGMSQRQQQDGAPIAGNNGSDQERGSGAEEAQSRNGQPRASSFSPAPSRLPEAATPRAAKDAGYFIVIGLDMAPFENALTTGKRSIAFTAFLVGLLGVGGFISLFWAQSYKFSRRLLLDTSAITDKVISSLPLGLVILDASGKVTEANSVAETLFGYPEKGLLGLTPDRIPGADWQGIANRVGRGEPVLEEEQALVLPEADKSGEPRTMPVSVSAASILNDQGESLGMFYLLRDLREVKRLQNELRRNERLSTLGNMAARVAHEIRNPLSSIKGFATYLGSRHTGAADAEAARTMIGEVDRLNRVVSELLDFAGPSSLTIAPVDMRAVLERALRLAEMDACAGGVELDFTVSLPAGRDAIYAAVDAERITQALLNLLLNAVQATDRGGRVAVSLAPAQGDKVLISIADSGRGMPPEVLQQIFNPYFTTKASGTGLGLSIVSKIVEDHDGEIKVQSVEGRGTTILLLLPGAENFSADFSGDSDE